MVGGCAILHFHQICVKFSSSVSMPKLDRVNLFEPFQQVFSGISSALSVIDWVVFLLLLSESSLYTLDPSLLSDT